MLMGKEYDKLENEIRQHVLSKFSNRLKEQKVCILIMPSKIGKLIDRLQNEIVDWYEKEKK